MEMLLVLCLTLCLSYPPVSKKHSISSFPPSWKKHKKMLGNSSVNSKRYAVVIAFGKAHDNGHSSTVNCLKIALKEAEGIRVCGRPFRLVNKSGFYIWRNDEIREKKINEGSIVEIGTVSEYKYWKKFLSNSGHRMVSLLMFAMF